MKRPGFSGAFFYGGDSVQMICRQKKSDAAASDFHLRLSALPDTHYQMITRCSGGKYILSPGLTSKAL
jgi:hypothetical protein